MMKTSIHSTALVDDSAEIAEGVFIGPYSVIGPKVKISRDSRIHAHCVVEHCQIGEGNEIFSHCVVGGRPQVIGDPGEGRLSIGDRNIIREATHIHRGSYKDKGTTSIGDDNFIMSQCHIAHDCQLKNKITMASYSGLAGHCSIGNSVVLSGSTNVSQFVRVGDYAFTAGRAKVRLDVPPFLVTRDYSKLVGPNMVGLKRNNFSSDEISMVKTLYKRIFLKKESSQSVFKDLDQEYSSNLHYIRFKEFMLSSKMGIMTKI